MTTVNLGRVQPIDRGGYSPTYPYKKLDFVSSQDKLNYYTCIKDAPVGTALTNTEFFRPALQSPATAEGIGYEGSTVKEAIDELFSSSYSFDSVADMQSAAWLKVGGKVRTLGYYTPGDGGGNDYEVVAAGTGTDDGGSFIDLAGSGLQAKGLFSGDCVFVEQFGAYTGPADNTPHYDALIAYVDDGTLVKWSRQAEYTGNFISESKSLRCDVNGATLVNATNDSIIQIGSFTVDEYTVTEAELQYGDRQFTVVGASGLFSAGDIGYLWDGALRPTGGSVNFEVVKIESIAGDVITVNGFLASYQGASTIRFYHSPVQLKSPEIKNVNIRSGTGHTGFGAIIANCESPMFDNIETNNTTGNAVAARYCHGVGARNIRPLKPADTTSGNGYGFAMFAVTCFVIRDVHGDGCRHVYDQDSAYFGVVENISDMDDQSAPVVLAHNGFAGHTSCRNVRVRTSQRAVSAGSQGYGGSPSADRDKHPHRNIIVDGVDVVIKEGISPNDSNVPGVYFQNSAINCAVRNLSIRHEDQTPLASPANSFAVRVIGTVKGFFSVENISADRLGAFFYAEDQGIGSGDTVDNCIARFRGLRADSVAHGIYTGGRYSVDVNDISTVNAPLSGRAIFMAQANGESPVSLFVGDSVDVGTTTAIYETQSPVFGRTPNSTRLSGNAVQVTAGQALTEEDIQLRNGYADVAAPVGAGVVTLSATEALPPPHVTGSELYLRHFFSGRQDVEFPAGNNIQATFTLSYNEAIRLVAISGKWAVYSTSVAA